MHSNKPPQESSLFFLSLAAGSEDLKVIVNPFCSMKFLQRRKPSNATKAAEVFNRSPHLLHRLNVPDPAVTNTTSRSTERRNPDTPHTTVTGDFLSALDAGYRQAGVTPNTPLLVAVSGGLDSMVLLSATRQLWPDFRGLTIAHLDHGLRSAGRTDREFVEQTAAQWQIPCISESLPAGTIAAEQGSLEEAARTLRYRFLQQAAAQCGATVVVTAHHRSDQVETVLHNLLRGTGLRGLGGMSMERPLENSVRLVRPLHAIPRAVLVRWAEDRGIPFREDETNRDPAFTRNRLRHQILPALRECNPQLDDVLARLADQAQATVAVLDEFADLLLDQQALEQQPQAARFRRPPLARLSDATRRHLLTTLWRRQGWPRQKMTSTHWQQLSNLLRQPSGRLELPGTICVTTTETMVRFLAPPSW